MLQQPTWGFVLALGPAISIVSGIIGGLIVSLYIHRVTIPLMNQNSKETNKKLDHITVLTNSTLSAAHERIEELEKTVEVQKKDITSLTNATADLATKVEQK